MRKSPEKHQDSRGGIRSPEYRAWQGMLYRCYDSNCPQYRNYGARGIKVCKRWRDSYVAFLQDVGRKPSTSHSIDRIDNNGNYKPGNVRWATMPEQSANRRTNRLITIKGVTKTLGQWAKIANLQPDTFRRRIEKHWPEQYLLRPLILQKGKSHAEC